MRGNFRKIWAVLLLFSCLGSSDGHAQRLPWPAVDPLAEAAYLDILPEMQHGRHGKSQAMWLAGAKAFSQHPSDQLLFLLGLGNTLRMRAKFAESLACYHLCQDRYKTLLAQNPTAKALLVEGYADLAFEYNQVSTRQAAIDACTKVHALLPADSPRKTILARKIAVLCRILKQFELADKWLATAQATDNGLCGESAQLRCELAYAAIKKDSFDLAETHFEAARQLMAACGNVLQEDWITYYFYVSELHSAQSSTFSTSLAEMEAAENALKAAVKIGETHPEVVSNLLYVCQGKLAKLRSELGDFAGAVPYAESSVNGQVGRDIFPRGISQAYTHLGDIHHYLGHFEQALNCYQQAWLWLHNSNEIGQGTYFSRLANYAQELINIGKFTEGEKHMHDAIAGFVAKSPDDYTRLGKQYENLGIGYLLQRKNEAAISAFQNALCNYEMTNAVSWPDHCYSQVQLAVAYKAVGNLEMAHAHLDKSRMELAKISPNNPMERAIVLEVITDFYIQEGNFGEAFNLNDLFMREMVGPTAVMGKDSLECPNLDKSVSPWHTLAAASQKASILWGRYRETHDLRYLHANLACSQKALAKLRKLRQEHNNEQEKLRVNQYWQTLFEKAMRAAMELHAQTHSPEHLQTAFEIAEQSRAMLLMEAVLDNHVLETNAQSASLADRRQRTQTRIMRLRQAINASASSSGDMASLTSELLAAENELDRIMEEIKAANPKYSDLVNAFDVVTVAELQPQLQRAQRGLVEYFYGDSAIHAMVVTPDTFFVHTFHPDAAFNNTLESLTRSLHQKPELVGEKAAQAFASQSQTILKAIWQPIAAYLPRAVTVIPDGPLSFISFEALADSVPAKPPFGFQHLGYLLERHTISYDYSATFLARHQYRPAPRRNNVLAIAPSFGENPNVAPLPESVNGVRKLAGDFPEVNALLENAGTKRAFLEHAPQSAIIDLATHGRYDHKNFLNSCIYFSPDGSGDSILLLNELYTLNLPAQLAILEACETGLGDYQQGEGVMSLARGFTYAGCRSVLMSLWEVAECPSTRTIMGDFFNNLADSLPRDEAIAKAKRDFLNQLRLEKGYAIDQTHPYYWSELVMIGDNSPLPIAKPQQSWTMTLLGFAGIVFTLAVGAWIGRKRYLLAKAKRNAVQGLNTANSGMAASRS